ncbi:MAG: S-layer protein, partial [Candidatus Methanofastidiosia archaeon]
GYEIRVLDVDIDSNKVLLLITMPNGYLHEFWMILDPLHGFSANPQVFSSTGEGEEYNGLSKDDVWIDFEYIYYRDSLGYYHTQYSYPLFVLDGIATFVGADGTTGALFNIYTLRDNEIFRSSQCCKLFTEKPNSYALWIDQMRTDEPRIGNYSQPHIFYLDNLFPTRPQWPQNLFFLPIEEFFGEGFVSGFINFKGTWDSIDSHATTSGPVVIPFGPDGNPQNLSSPEAVPWPYADRDQNDFVWWNEDCFSRKYSHWFMGTWDSGAPITDFIEGGNTPIPNADYMWEMNFALCDTIEMIKCETKYEVSGPYSYFKLKLTDITWDDDSDGLKDTEFDDGIDFSIEFSVSGITYRELMVVELDEASLVKLDIEIDFKSLKKNLILVGGDQVNFIVERLVDERIRPDDFSEVKWFLYQGGYKLYTDPFKEGFNVLVVAGPDRYETRAAAEYLVRDMDF